MIKRPGPERRARCKYAQLAFSVALVLTAATWMSSLDARQVPAPEGPATASGSSILDGVYTATQAARGADEFERACSACHQVRDHAGRRFGVLWADSTLGDVFDLISTTMPESDPGGLAPEAYASIIALLLKESGYPEGQQDLPAESDALKKIRIEPLPQ